MLERGDLVLVPFPFTDLSASKRRPVLALTSSDAYGDFIGMPVTSRPQQDHALPLGPAELARGSLPVASWIRTDRVVTLSATLVVKVLAGVAEPVVATAVQRLCAYLMQPGGSSR
jgi:mRNA interferase MazF